MTGIKMGANAMTFTEPSNSLPFSRDSPGSLRDGSLFLTPADAVMDSPVSELWDEKCQCPSWGSLRIMQSILPSLLDLFHFFPPENNATPSYKRNFYPLLHSSDVVQIILWYRLSAFPPMNFLPLFLL